MHVSALPEFAKSAVVADALGISYVLLKNELVSEMLEASSGARVAALAGTRQMIADDSFSALVGALVEAGAVPREIMAGALLKLADGLIAKARGAMESDYAIYPSEIFDRVRSLGEMATALRGGNFSGSAQ